MFLQTGLITAVTWPAALMSAAGAIDNPWHVCTQRATETGKQLAEVILGREQGNRPVTLIGFSMGSRVIFSCLEELSKRKGKHTSAYGKVQDNLDFKLWIIMCWVSVYKIIMCWASIYKIIMCLASIYKIIMCWASICEFNPSL